MPDTPQTQTGSWGGWYFDFVLSKHDEPLRSVMRRRRSARIALSERVASEAWDAADGKGPIPPWLVHTFNVHLGPWCAAALRADAAVSPSDAAELTATMLRAAVNYAAAGPG